MGTGNSSMLTDAAGTHTDSNPLAGLRVSSQVVSALRAVTKMRAPGENRATRSPPGQSYACGPEATAPTMATSATPAVGGASSPRAPRVNAMPLAPIAAAAHARMPRRPLATVSPLAAPATGARG